MIHYNVWFNLKPEVHEAEGLAAMGQFLGLLGEAGEIVTFQILRNAGSSSRSKLPRFQALITFSDADQLADSMKKQAVRGIHSGLHGAIIDFVTDFHVEVFTLLEAIEIHEAVGQQACEI